MTQTGRRVCLVLLAFLGGASVAHAQPEGRRLALVIGISAYSALEPLDRPITDAWNVGDVLRREAKFAVTPIMDAGVASFRQQLADFAARVQPNDVVVIYYAGHGVQAGGRNYLLPGDFPDDAGQLDTHAITADELLRTVGANGPSLKLLILDACRTSPLRGVAASGLAPMEPQAFGAGTRIEFAASAGQAARDGLFAEKLVQELVRPGQDVDAVFRNVRVQVAEASQGLQTTMSASQMTFNFYFIPAQAAGQGDALAHLERVAAARPRGDMGQVDALQALVQQRHSLAGTELLEGLPLIGGTFNGASLARTQLAGTDFTGASLRDADLTRASLTVATLSGTDLTGATADSAGFAFTLADSARFSGARARGSSWLATRARGADFRNAILAGAGFGYADLRGARFDGANLSGAVFLATDLRGASFEGARLDNTDFTGSLLDDRALTAAQRSQACSTPAPVVPDGTFGHVLTVVVVEPIPNSRFSGGVEYSRFSETQHLFRLPPTGFPACAPRVLDNRGWFPLWQSRGEEMIRDDVSFRVSHALLEQAGRRAEVRTRIEQHLDWLYPFPAGVFTTDIAAADLAPDMRAAAGRWSLTFLDDGTVRLQRQGEAAMPFRYEQQPRYRFALTGPTDPFGCDARHAEYRWYRTPEGDLAFSPYQDPCALRAAVMQRTWRERP